MLRAVSGGSDERLSTWQSLRAVTGSWRLLAVVLLSFSSGLPLGLVWIAIPAWMARLGVDIRVIGLFTLAQAPWSFKFLWAPLMDRYAPVGLGRKRGWILLAQLVLAVLGLVLAGVADEPDIAGVVAALALAIGLAAATQDIAIDAYAVEALRKDEHGMAVGARVAFYRLAMQLSGSAAITLSSASFDIPIPGLGALHYEGSWALVNLLLAATYIPSALVTWWAPEPESLPAPPRSLKDAVFGPFLGLLGQHRALEILSFVVLFKLSDNLTQALLRPFFVQMGFNDFDVGIGPGIVGNIGILGGTLLGGLLTGWVGLGRALWITGILQIFSNLGYAVVAQLGANRIALYSAQAFEFTMSGLGTGAFSVLLLRLTQKRFSATQYALLSSLFAIPRILAGPPTGLLVDAIGWRDFFILTIVAGIPGMIMLQRFVPWGTREPTFHVSVERHGEPLTTRSVLTRAAVGTLVATLVCWGSLAALQAMRLARAGESVDFAALLLAQIIPAGLTGWITLIGIGVISASVGLGVAATLVARHGFARGDPSSGGL